MRVVLFLIAGCGTVGTAEFGFRPAGTRDAPPCAASPSAELLARACVREESWLAMETVRVVRRTSYHPDHGRIIRIETDGNEVSGQAADGVPDSIVEYAWVHGGQAIGGRLDSRTSRPVSGWCNVSDDEGRLVERWEIAPDGGWWPTQRLRWQGHVVVESCVQADCSIRMRTEVDSTGRPVDRRRFDASELVDQSVWRWQPLQGIRATYERLTVWPRNGPRERGTVDGLGHVLAFEVAPSSTADFGPLTERDYNEAGQLIESRVWDDGELLSRERYLYDAGTLAMWASDYARWDAPREGWGWLRTRRTLGPAGQERLVVSNTINAHGVLQDRFERSVAYTPEGIPVGEVVREDLDGNGLWDSVDTFEWSPLTCP